MQRVAESQKVLGLNTVCEEALCPNRMECYSHKTLTFMILGSICTRHCRFCAVAKGTPQPVDRSEPQKIADLVERLKIRWAVVTSVTRDDLPDGGASHFAATVEALRKTTDSRIELLVPDFQGDLEALKVVIEARPDVLNHNVETVPRLYRQVRPGASYERSLAIYRYAKQTAPEMLVKSGFMVGLGECSEEVLCLMDDLRGAGCDLLSIGQYLAPSKEHLPVAEYIHPERFENYRQEALKRGFKMVMSGPFVRSSYQAAQTLFLTELR